MSFQNVAGTALDGGQAATNAAFDSAKGALGAVTESQYSSNRWTEIKIENKSSAGTLEISSVKTSGGHMYPKGEPWKSIEDKSFAGVVINPGKSYIHRAVANESSPAPIDGSFILKDKATGKDECMVFFTIPWRSGESSIKYDSIGGDETWNFGISQGESRKEGNLGNVTIVAFGSA